MIPFSRSMYPDSVVVTRRAGVTGKIGDASKGAADSSATLPCSVQAKTTTLYQSQGRQGVVIPEERTIYSVNFPADPGLADGDEILFGSILLNVHGIAKTRGSGGRNWRVRCEYVGG